MALKKPSDLFNKKETSGVFEASEVSPHITESYNKFIDNFETVNEISEKTKIFERVSELSEKVESLSQELSGRLTKSDLENAMLSQLMVLDENFKSLQNQVKGLNKQDLKEFKETVIGLTEIVDNLVETELPKYKKQITRNELYVDEQVNHLQKVVDGNISGIREEIDEKFDNIADVVDNNIGYLNQKIEETSLQVKKTTDTYTNISKILENKVSHENKKFEEYSELIENLSQAFEDLSYVLKEELSASSQLTEDKLEEYVEQFKIISNNLERSIDDRFKDYQNQILDIKADVVINEQHIKNIDKYLEDHHQELIELKEEVFTEIEKLPVGNIQENLEILEKKIDYIKDTYSKINPEVVVKEVIREGLLNEPADTKNSDPLTSLDQNFVTFNQLQEHYRLFLNRIQQQLSTIGGGGETRLRYLDDIVGIATNPSAYDNKYLKYNHSIGKFEFVTVSGGGGGSGDYASVAGIATNADYANYASVAGIATNAEYANYANNAATADNASVADFANNAGIASSSQGLSGEPNIKIGFTTITGVGNTALIVNGDVRITGILTIGTSSLTLNGTNNTIKVGTGLTITEDGNAIYSGVITASSFSGNASSATYAPNAGVATYASTAGVATALQNSRTFQITGDVVASAISFDGTGNVSFAATIQPNSVGLGTDTTGDYVQSLTGTANQITVTGGTGETSNPVLSFPNQLTVPQDLTVTRDVQINRNLNVNGNITIGGTSATLFTSEFKVFDPDIVLGFRTDALNNDVSTDSTASHGGIAIASTEGTPLVQLFIAGIETNPATYKKFMWFKAGEFSGLGTDAWLSNYAVGIGSTQFPTGTRLAAGAVQFTERDLAVIRNINASGVITATSFSGNASSATYATNAGIATYATNAGIATYASTAGISTNVIGGISSITQLQVTGVSTFSNGPVFIGAATSTGTALQRLQVTGGASFTGTGSSVGIGTTNPRETLDIIGTIGVQASGAANRFEIQHNTSLNSLDFIFV